jgi:hypothetical protein
MAQRMCKHQVLINFYEIEWLEAFTRSLQIGLTMSYVSKMATNSRAYIYLYIVSELRITPCALRVTGENAHE